MTAPAHVDAVTAHDGERVLVPERVVVAPRDGRFHPAEPGVVTTEGEIVHAGQVIGEVERSGERTPVRSPFTGFLMGVLAAPTELVRCDQPVAWLRETGP